MDEVVTILQPENGRSLFEHISPESQVEAYKELFGITKAPEFFPKSSECLILPRLSLLAEINAIKHLFGEKGNSELFKRICMKASLDGLKIGFPFHTFLGKPVPESVKKMEMDAVDENWVAMPYSMGRTGNSILQVSGLTAVQSMLFLMIRSELREESFEINTSDGLILRQTDEAILIYGMTNRDLIKSNNKGQKTFSF